jgi:putative transcriptional regulator
MPTKRRQPSKSDWARIDATTDEEIAAQIADDPDTAPDLADTIAARIGRVEPPEVDPIQ